VYLRCVLTCGRIETLAMALGLSKHMFETKRINTSILVLLTACSMLSRPVLAQKRSEIGIDRSGLSREDAATQKKTFEDIRTLHATWFRDGPTSGSAQGVANFVEEVRQAKQ
jgi:hypothetical protein